MCGTYAKIGTAEVGNLAELFLRLPLTSEQVDPAL